MRPALVAAAVVLLLVAGCLGGSDDEPPASDPARRNGTEEAGNGQARAPNATGEEAPGPGSTVLYVSAQGTLVEEPPTGETPASFPMQAFVPGLATGDFEPVTFTGEGPPFDLAVTRARVVFYYTQDVPGQRDPNFPPFGAFWGPVDGTMAFSFGGEDKASMQAGEVVEASIELPLPPGGLVFPDELLHELWLVGGYHPSAQGVTNGRVLAASTTTPSRIEVDSVPVELPETTATEVLRETVTLEGGDCYGVEGPNTVAVLPFDVPAGTAGVHATLTRTGGQGQDDADIDLLGPSGQPVGGGHSPYGDEVVRLYKPNVDAAGTGSWAARVNVCGLQQGTFDVVVNLLSPVE